MMMMMMMVIIIIIIIIIIIMSQISNKVLNEKFGSHNRKTFNRFTAQDSSRPSNITHYTKHPAV